MGIEVIYEDEYIIVVNKPSNLLVHHSKYARNIEEVSLTEMLRQSGFTEASPVHRLDRKTSGLILFAKKKEDVAVFQALFTENQIEKVYYALLRGFLPDKGIIDSPVKNDRGNYKEAETHFELIQTYECPFVIPPYAEQRYSLVKLIPKTGRMHQLRIHANKIAHPIINDPKYGNRHHNHYFQEVLGIHELFLHAGKLCFSHPIKQLQIDLYAQVPSFWFGFDPELSSVQLFK